MQVGDKVTIYDINHNPVNTGTYDGEYLANQGTTREVIVYSATGNNGVGYLSIDGYYFIINPVSSSLTSIVWIGAAITAYIIYRTLSKRKEI